MRGKRIFCILLLHYTSVFPSCRVASPPRTYPSLLLFHLLAQHQRRKNGVCRMGEEEEDNTSGPPGFILDPRERYEIYLVVVVV